MDFDPAYLLCEVNIKEDQNLAYCSSTDNSFPPFTVKPEEIIKTNNHTDHGHDDMVDMEHFNEAELLENLRKRFYNR
jgi:myosin heavy subunit